MKKRKKNGNMDGNERQMKKTDNRKMVMVTMIMIGDKESENLQLI